ncbi:MAG: formylglycine-generating enzyme family protein [Candidatus Promineifilaceae bacterium]
MGRQIAKSGHPVVYVNYHDAVGYAEWAGMFLPSEEEWEKAARGSDGRMHPWGDKWRDGCCNTDEAGIGTTTPAGRYSPQGDSPYGCVDMAGNVWEWTESWFDAAKARRVVRGGSWNVNQVSARCVSQQQSSCAPLQRYRFPVGGSSSPISMITDH